MLIAIYVALVVFYNILHNKFSLSSSWAGAVVQW